MNTLRWKRLVGKAMPFPGGAREVILLYHAIGESAWAVSPGAFHRQVSWLRENADIVPLAEIGCGANASGLRVALTFDDGYATVHDVAGPVLAEFGCTATVFLNTGHIAHGARKRSDTAQGHYSGESFMTWTEAARLAGHGWTLGSHAVHHADLTALDAPTLERELAESKAAVESNSGRPCTQFAYPWGRHSRKVQAAVKAAGYSCAVGGIHGAVRITSDRFALPRIDVRREYEIGDFEAAIRGRWDFLAVHQKLLAAR